MISGVVDAASNFIPGKAAATGSVKAGVKGLINAEVKHVAGDAVGALAHAGKTTVYHTVENGIVKYVGITDDMAARAAAHLREKGINIEQIPGLTGLAREDARAVEQVLIQTIRLGKDGGSLLNKINSIAKTNLNYSEALKRGVELLKQAGYSGF